MSKPVTSHLEKNSFIAQLASMSPSEINDYIRTNGKVKRFNPFIRITSEMKDSTNNTQEDKNYGNNQ